MLSSYDIINLVCKIIRCLTWILNLSRLPIMISANTNTENVTDEAIQLHYGRDTVMAAITHADGTVKEFRLSDFKVAEKLEKFMEDVK